MATFCKCLTSVHSTVKTSCSCIQYSHKEDALGVACSMNWMKMRTEVYSENLKGWDHLEELGMDGG